MSAAEGPGVDGVGVLRGWRGSRGRRGSGERWKRRGWRGGLDRQWRRARGSIGEGGDGGIGGEAGKTGIAGKPWDAAYPDDLRIAGDAGMAQGGGRALSSPQARSYRRCPAAARGGPKLEGNDIIYLDNHSTTPVDRRVAAVVCEALRSTFGNPNSVAHAVGTEARRVLEDSRAHVAILAGVDSRDVVLTCGATEAIQLAIAHARTACLSRSPLRVVSTPVEHRSVLRALDELRKGEAAEVRYLSVDRAGRIDPTDLRRHLTEGADLVCIMAANNEVGTLYPVAQIAAMARDAKALLLVDATQAAGRMPLHAKEWGVDYLTLSGHKIYGPKGTGCLAFGTGLQLAEQPASTPNVPAMAGFGEACRLRVMEMADDEPRISRLRDRLQDLLQSKIPDLVVNGDTCARLNGNLHVSIPGTLNDAVLSRLHDRVALSTGSACTSGAHSPSHVLVALGLEEELIDGALRIGVGKFTTAEEIERAAELISNAALEVREAINRRAGAAAKG